MTNLTLEFEKSENGEYQWQEDGLRRRLRREARRKFGKRKNTDSMMIYTFGHSTRALEEFVAILKNFEIELVIDVRRFPSSKKFPWFSKESLEKELRANRIDYLHYPELGGYRKEGYEAFSQSEEFEAAINKLIEIINNRQAAILCAEWNPMKCHRWYISEKLVKIGHEVVHIISQEKIQGHLELPKKKAKVKCDKLKFS